MMKVARLRKSAAVLGALMALAPLHPAHAQSETSRYLTSAARLYESLEYERALEQLAQARRLPRTLAEDVRIALYEGLILADMGRTEEARGAFKAGLLLDPEARLPVRASPKVEREFEQVRARVRKELGLPPLKSQESKQRDARAEATGPTKRPEAPGAKAPEPSGTDRPETPGTNRAEPPQVAVVPPPEEPRPWLPSSVRMGNVSVPTPSLALAGAGVLAAGAGGLFGLRSREQLQAARAADFQQDMGARQGEAQGSARVANVLFGAAGLLVSGAVVTWVLSGGEEVPMNEEAAR